MDDKTGRFIGFIKGKNKSEAQRKARRDYPECVVSACVTVEKNKLFRSQFTHKKRLDMYDMNS